MRRCAPGRTSIVVVFAISCGSGEPGPAPTATATATATATVTSEASAAPPEPSNAISGPIASQSTDPPTSLSAVSELPPLERSVKPVDRMPPSSRDDVMDFSHDEVVFSGEGTGPGNGVAGGSAPAAPPMAATSKRQAAKLLGSNLSCAFPPEADEEQIDEGRVMLVVDVDATGKATRVTVVSDPGHGFGRAARACMLKQKYSPGLDDEGKPAASKTPPLAVNFRR